MKERKEPRDAEVEDSRQAAKPVVKMSRRNLYVRSRCQPRFLLEHERPDARGEQRRSVPRTP